MPEDGVAIVFGKERMEAIEAASIIDGLVNVDGDLMLKNFGGDWINAGHVVGPQGDDGDQNVVVDDTRVEADTPDLFTETITVTGTASTVGTWFAAPATVTTVRGSTGDRVVQTLVVKNTGVVWVRTSMSPTTWAAWVQYPTKTYVDALGVSAATANTIMRRDGSGKAQVATPTAAADIVRKDYADGLITPTSIPGSANLNSYTANGVYYQTSNANAASGSNYPVALAGLLEVSTPSSGYVHQRYTVYRDGTLANQRTWTRRFYSSVWSDWTSPDGDSGLVTSGIATASTGWTVDSQQARKFGPFIWLYLAITRTGAAISVGGTGNITNVNICTLGTAWRPMAAGNALSLTSASTGRAAMFALTSAGVVSIAAVGGTSDCASGEQWSLSGMYMADT